MLRRMPSPSVSSDHVFHALGDATRRAIVLQLGRGPASVSDLAEPLPVNLATVLQHVQVLETSGLVSTHKVGRVRTCHLVPAALLEAERWLADRRALWDGRLDRLDALVHVEAARREAARSAPSTPNPDSPTEGEPP